MREMKSNEDWIFFRICIANLLSSSLNSPSFSPERTSELFGAYLASFSPSRQPYEGSSRQSRQSVLS